MDGDDTREGQGEVPLTAETTPTDPGPRRPAPARLAIVAGGIILLGLVAFAVSRRAAQAPAGPAATPDPGAAAETPAGAPQQGTPIVAVAVNLSAEAAIVAERYRCVCGCNDPLSVCACTLTPGSIDMKKYVQELVDQKKSVGEIDAAMVARYGEAALLSNTPPQVGQTAPAPGSAPASPPARPRKPRTARPS